MFPESNESIYREFNAFIPTSRLISDPLRTLAYGTDASFYRQIPKLVVEVADETEVVRCLEVARENGTPVTFRAAGTSLSGQAITDSVLLRLGHGWRGYSINEDASEIRLQPGVIGEQANRYLAPFRRKIGPDPASINVAKIGGIAANNASGMCCGTAQNSYQTLVSMRVILADGSVLDTADEASRMAFAESHGEMLERIDRLAHETKQNGALAQRIRAKFKIKNTNGYSLNALVDLDDPIDILQHLMIGSEGTLGFIAEVTYRTVEDHPHKASALAFFPDIRTACEAVAILKSEPVVAVELMDRAAIHSVENQLSMPDDLKELSEDAAALLIETRAADGDTLNSQVNDIRAAIASVDTLYPVRFTDQIEEYTRLWNLRKGMFPSVGAMREIGTTVIIEDIAFQVSKLAPATLDLQALFKKYAYHEAIIFGHALEGNLHFVFTQDFETPEEVDRYRRFMDNVCEMVVKKYDGSLKGEHGTGRNMAPFVELEWGPQAYALMWEIKAIFDPDNILNPGVILNDDPHAHIKNLKPLFSVDPLVDKCTECGFCEPACPSRALSLTPRQRIVGLREMARLEASGEDPEREKSLRELYQYQGIDTCAGDGLCSIACPVDIDTGRMMKVLRGREMGATGTKVADLVAEHFGAVSTTTRLSLSAAHLAHTALGTSVMQGLTSGVRKLSGSRIPLWNPFMPTSCRLPAKSVNIGSESPRVVYFPSCSSRTMGPARGDPEREALPDKFEGLLRKAGYTVVYPSDCDRLCCGMPFESKGAFSQADAKLRMTEQALVEASRNGQNPVVFDTSPCTYRMKQNLEADLRLFDITEFIHDFLMARLAIRKLPEVVALHPTCSTRKMGLADKLQNIAETCAAQVIVPEEVSCCGWAGDKGFTVPELNESAVRNLRPSLSDDCVAGYSTGRTCEIGLSFHSGRYYRSIAYLLDRCSEPKEPLSERELDERGT
jgi:D-lactate dehydrogenase